MRRWLIFGLGLATVMLIAGCGGTSRQSEFQPSAESEISSEAEEAPYEAVEESETEEVGGPLANVGTITVLPEQGEEFTNHYRLGPLLYASDGSPPEEALAACNPAAAVPIDRSVFARGEVTVKYSQGTLPAEFDENLGYDTVVTNGDGEGLLAIRVDGEWQCRTSFYLEFQPGESQTFPIWVIIQGVLTNSRPRVPASVFNTWYFGPVTPYNVSLGLVIRGPGAGWCEEEWEGKVERLFLYNRSGRC